MIKKDILYFGRKAIIACDEKCEKAWGINSRPTIKLDKEDDDDVAFLSDEELGLAPKDPGTYEGGHAKPIDREDRLNKWCCRECERCYLSSPDEYDLPVKLKDFSKRRYNIKTKQISLTFDKGVSRLAGLENGRNLYNEQLKNKIHIGRNHIIEIPSNIEDISISFVLGMTEELLKIMSLDDFDEYIKFNAEDKIVDKIKKSMRY